MTSADTRTATPTVQARPVVAAPLAAAQKFLSVVLNCALLAFSKNTIVWWYQGERGFSVADNET